MPLVSAIILNYRTPYDTIACVDAILNQTIADQIEIIVVDNKSDDKSVDIMRRALSPGNKIRIIETGGNVGFARGNNLGVASAAGTYILIINPDTLLERNAVGTMTEFMEENPDVGIVGPQLAFPDGTIRDSFRTFPTISDIIIKRTALRLFFPNRMRKYLQWDRNPFETGDVDWLVGACLLMRKDFFEKIGMFDTRFFLFLEDTDLCRRCHLAGERVVYLPKARGKDGLHRLSAGGILSLIRKKTVRTHVTSAAKYFWKWRRKSSFSLPEQSPSNSLATPCLRSRWKRNNATKT